MFRSRAVPLLVFTLLVALFIGLGCAMLEQNYSDFKSALGGREVTIQTYDEESNIIDRVTAKSVDIAPENMFATTDSQGATVEKSSVVNLVVGGKTMLHVGSTMIIAEKGLVDVFDEFAKKVDITSIHRSTPFVNRMVNDMKNLTVGQKFLILIRSQTGKPLASFVGNKVSYFATSIDKSTTFRIDGKTLFVYRADYTILDLSLIQ